jgi:acetyl-CoA C-acetyltransferase
VTATVDPRAPCLIGVAQHTVHPGQQPAPEPLELWTEVCRAAAEDAGATGGAAAVLAAIDSLQIVYCQSWQYDDPPGRLAGRLGIQPRHSLYSGIGGTTPQLLVQNAAEAILRGDLDAVIVTGAEALETRRQVKKAGEKVHWSFPELERSPFPFEAPFHPAEVAHSVFQAWLTFPLWDVARRAHLGVEPSAYREGLGRLMAPMTDVAQANPYAWFRQPRSPAELITATPGNRMVGYPYTKFMVSIMDVDMAAAVVVASHAAADRLGVPADRRVYLRGWCYATDPVYVAEHEPMWSSPAMALASRAALDAAGATVDDVAHLDLYSCFGSSIHLALDALGLRPDDRRGVTVTGGLPFSGGAGSDYMTHSIATMADVLRRDPGSLGLVSGVGMHLTKHCFGVYSTSPGPVGPADQAAVQARLDARAVKLITDVAQPGGAGTVATYTVAHARDGSPEWGVAVCDLPDGTRCYARVEDPDLLAHIEAVEWVGTTVELAPLDSNVNLVKS